MKTYLSMRYTVITENGLLNWGWSGAISREPQKRLENASHAKNRRIHWTTLSDSRKLPTPLEI
jgi:hypothetical protein